MGSIEDTNMGEIMKKTFHSKSLPRLAKKYAQITGHAEGRSGGWIYQLPQYYVDNPQIAAWQRPGGSSVPADHRSNEHPICQGWWAYAERLVNRGVIVQDSEYGKPATYAITVEIPDPEPETIVRVDDAKAVAELIEDLKVRPASNQAIKRVVITHQERLRITLYLSELQKAYEKGAI